jgi:hypothetical protein
MFDNCYIKNNYQIKCIAGIPNNKLQLNNSIYQEEEIITT